MIRAGFPRRRAAPLRAAVALAAAALLTGAAAVPARAQPPRGQAAPEESVAAEETVPADPAAAPPDPARLDGTATPAPPGPAAAAPQPPAASPLPGLEPLPDGAWRLRFAGTAAALPPRAEASLAALGRRLAERPQGRFTLLAQASGPEADASAARRLALARGIAVKAALAAGGLPETRIDIRPLGRTEEALDAVDVLPPEALRPAAAAAAPAETRERTTGPRPAR